MVPHKALLSLLCYLLFTWLNCIFLLRKVLYSPMLMFFPLLLPLLRIAPTVGLSSQPSAESGPSQIPGTWTSQSPRLSLSTCVHRCNVIRLRPPAPPSSPRWPALSPLQQTSVARPLVRSKPGPLCTFLETTRPLPSCIRLC